MKECIVHPDFSTEIVDSPVPIPKEDEVVIKVVVSGMNPKDSRVSRQLKFLTSPPLTTSRKRPKNLNKPHNSGDDIAGIVTGVGGKVTAFRAGDRVAAFHVMMAPHGSFAEYAVAPAHTTFHIPASTSFEDAAAIPLAAGTAACGLFVTLGLPLPWALGRKDGDTNDAVPVGPLLVYGAASAIGAYAIQFAKRAGIGPIIGVAGRGIPFVETLLDKAAGDVIIDYRDGDEAVVEGIKKALNGRKLRYAFDGVTEKGSYVNISKVIDHDGGHLTGFQAAFTEGMEKWKPEGVIADFTLVGMVHKEQTDFGMFAYRWIASGLEQGWFKPHPVKVVPGGLGGVSTGLKDLYAGKASAVKYVFRIADTEGVARE